MKFADFPLKEVGHSIQLIGGVWEGNDYLYMFIIPEYTEDDVDIVMGDVVEANLDDWKELLRQGDLMETEVLSKCQEGKLYKAVIRKCQRLIDQQVTWNVYRRDKYTCRYCGRNNVPLTVDHLVLWEDGGPSIEDNLVAACKKCNKTRGNTPYEEWLKSPYYKRVSKHLPLDVRENNHALTWTLGNIDRVVKVRNR